MALPREFLEVAGGAVDRVQGTGLAVEVPDGAEWRGTVPGPQHVLLGVGALQGSVPPHVRDAGEGDLAPRGGGAVGHRGGSGKLRGHGVTRGSVLALPAARLVGVASECASSLFWSRLIHGGPSFPFGPSSSGSSASWGECSSSRDARAWGSSGAWSHLSAPEEHGEVHEEGVATCGRELHGLGVHDGEAEEDPTGRGVDPQQGPRRERAAQDLDDGVEGHGADHTLPTHSSSPGGLSVWLLVDGTCLGDHLLVLFLGDLFRHHFSLTVTKSACVGSWSIRKLATAASGVESAEVRENWHAVQVTTNLQ